MKFSLKAWFGFLAIVLAIVACGAPAQAPVAPAPVNDPNVFQLVANSDVKTLDAAGIFKDFTTQSGIDLNITYKGSVDIKNAIAALNAKTPTAVDAFLPASSLQIPISPSVTPVSVMKTYVVLAVRPDVAQGLGWDSAKGIGINDLINAIEGGKIQLAMTSASQSNSGQTFYLAALTGLCGKNVLTSDCLQKQEVVTGIKALLAGVLCKNTSTAFLKETFIKETIAGSNKCNAMITYESESIDTNKQLVAAGKSPLTVFYVNGATAIADEPLLYVENGNATKLDQYNKLVAYLQSPAVQARILSIGWRIGKIGITIANADQSVFNPAWGINTTTDFPLMQFPKATTTASAIDIYQTSYRKPSYTVYCLDNSGSMDTNGGHAQMTDAMDLILNPDRAAQVQLQATSKDVSVVYAFSNDTQLIGSVAGNDPSQLVALSKQVSGTDLGGGTALFDCLATAMTYVQKNYDPSYAWEIVAMTDGASNQGMAVNDFVGTYDANSKTVTTNTNGFWEKSQYQIPVYSIAFGDADLSQLNALTATGGSVCVGTSGGDALAKCFRDAKGNN